MFDFDGSELEKFYNGVKSIPIGEVLTFNQLADVGFDVKRNRGLIYAVNEHLLEKDQKMLISLRNRGYKMAESREQMDHAWKRKTFAWRQINKAVKETTHLDTTKLTADERKTLTDREIYLKQQLRALRVRNIQAQKIAKQAIVKVEKSVEMQQESLKHIDRLIKEAETIRQRLKG